MAFRKFPEPKPKPRDVPRAKPAPAPKAAPKPEPPPPPKVVPKLDQARTLLTAYWGATGTDRSFIDAKGSLRKLGLSSQDVQTLRDALPLSATGPTGDRVRECDAFLARLG